MHYNALGRNPGIDAPFAFVMVAQEAVDEGRHRVERQSGGIAVGRMAHTRQNCRFHRAVAFVLRRFDLLDSAVLVVGALHDEDGHADITKRLGDIPGAKFRIEPRPVPGVEGAIDIVVPALELLPQIAGLVVLVGAADLGETHRPR